MRHNKCPTKITWNICSCFAERADFLVLPSIEIAGETIAKISGTLLSLNLGIQCLNILTTDIISPPKITNIKMKDNITKYVNN